nr:MAG TPA: hypothetical protein [Caudoviricetes sp.]
MALKGVIHALLSPVFVLHSRSLFLYTFIPSVSRYLLGEWTMPYILSIMIG